MNICICNNEEFRLECTCFRCKTTISKKLSDTLRKMQCPLHGGIMCCGNYEYACKKCSEEGWYSTAGFGGKTEHINKKTGEKRLISYDALKSDPF